MVVGAGPAGLVLAHLLHQRGIPGVVLERRSREHVLARVRAGALEPATVRTLREVGLGERLDAHAIVSTEFELWIDHVRHVIPIGDLVTESMVVFGQQLAVAGLLDLADERGIPVVFETEVTGVDDPTGRPVVRWSSATGEGAVTTRAVAACDGFHGVGRRLVPGAGDEALHRALPDAWLGVLLDTPPSGPNVVYAVAPEGFAMHSMRGRTMTRLYLQVPARDRLEQWPDERVMAELRGRLSAPGWALREGPVVERSLAPLRVYAAREMRHGAVFLAGDAAHVVPPAGAKGMNLAVRDAVALAPALDDLVTRGDEGAAAAYTGVCRPHVWRGIAHSVTWARLLHTTGDPVEDAIRVAELEVLATRRPGQSYLAHSTVGWE